MRPAALSLSLTLLLLRNDRQFVTTGERTLLKRTMQLVQHLAGEVQQQQQRRCTADAHHLGGPVDEEEAHDLHFASEVARAGGCRGCGAGWAAAAAAAAPARSSPLRLCRPGSAAWALPPGLRRLGSAARRLWHTPSCTPQQSARASNRRGPIHQTSHSDWSNHII
jgi:general stress protein YciG